MTNVIEVKLFKTRMCSVPYTAGLVNNNRPEGMRANSGTRNTTYHLEIGTIVTLDNQLPENVKFPKSVCCNYTGHLLSLQFCRYQRRKNLIKLPRNQKSKNRATILIKSLYQKG